MKPVFTLLVLTFLLTACNSATPAPPTENPSTDFPAGDAPVITGFTANPNAISVPGTSVALIWEVIGATSLSIDSGVGPVSGSSAVVYPPTTTTYTLTATNAYGESSATTIVTVSSEPPENPDPPETPDPPEAPNPPEPPETPDLPTGDVEITESVAYDESGYSFIIGTITNGSGRNIEFAKVVASLYNNDEFVGSDFTYSTLDILQPGESSPFKMYLLDAPNYDTYELVLEWDTTEEIPYRPEVRSLRLTNDFYPTITGQVRNATNETLEFVKIALTCYQNGELVDADFTYSDLDTLLPDATSPFTSYLISAYREPDRCEAIAQGRPN